MLHETNKRTQHTKTSACICRPALISQFFVQILPFMFYNMQIFNHTNKSKPKNISVFKATALYRGKKSFHLNELTLKLLLSCMYIQQLTIRRILFTISNYNSFIREAAYLFWYSLAKIFAFISLAIKFNWHFHTF